MNNYSCSTQDISKLLAKLTIQIKNIVRQRQPKGYVCNTVDPRNKINDLSNDEWLKRTSSLEITPEHKDLCARTYPHLHEIRKIMNETYGPEAAAAVFGEIVPSIKVHAEVIIDKYAKLHPAPFDERDIVHLVELLSKRGDKVLDPFGGSGSSLAACYKTGRIGGMIELYDQWIEVAEKRFSDLLGSRFENGKADLHIYQGDCLEVMDRLSAENVDLIITSPPYFNIFKKTKGERRERRLRQGLAVDYGNSPLDLGAADCYEGHLSQLGSFCSKCRRLLKRGKFMVLVVHDIAKDGFRPYHADLISVASKSGFRIRGIQVIADDWRKLRDYGIPRRFFLNFTHHYALVFQK